jgi:hypothetical protein
LNRIGALSVSLCVHTRSKPAAKSKVKSQKSKIKNQKAKREKRVSIADVSPIFRMTSSILKASHVACRTSHVSRLTLACVTMVHDCERLRAFIEFTTPALTAAL